MTSVVESAPSPTKPKHEARELHVERGLPLLGVIPSLMKNPLKYITDMAIARRGEIFALKIGPIDLHVVSDPEHVQIVLADEWRRFSKGGGMWDAIRPLLGNGLVTSEGDFWVKQRRLMQPLFGPKYLASLAPQMVAAVEKELALFEREAQGGAQLDVSQLMARVTQRVLLEAMFGTSIDPADEARLADQLLIALRTMNLRMFLYFAVDKIPLPGGRAFHKAILSIDEAMLRIVAERRASGVETTDLLSLLLRARDEGMTDGMDDRQLRDELVTLFVAGNDTTANALTWLCHVLDANPDVDARLRAELQAVLGGRAPTADDLPKLEYTRLVIQETMRLFPPVWMFPRFAREEVTVAGYKIKAGSALILCPFATHRDARHWERPDQIEPERFTKERVDARSKYAYFPFGGGPRHCIGNHFAMMEAQIITAMLLQRFRPRAVKGRPVELASASTLKPKDGLWMTLERPS